MAVYVYLTFAAIHVGLLIWSLMLYSRRPGLGMAIVSFITAGLVYDNAVIALGGNLGAGDSLLWLSMPRFIIHALLTPALLITALGFAQQFGLTIKPRLKQAAWGLVALLTVVGFVQGMVGVELRPACYEGTLRYTERVVAWQTCPNIDYTEAELTARGLPPIAAISTILLTGAVAVAIGRKTGYWTLLAGIVVMFIAAAIPASRVGPVVSNAGEVAMMLCFILTAAALQRRAAPQLAAA